MAAIPAGWSAEAHALWSKGEQLPAIFKTLEELNAAKVKPRALFAQIGFYSYLMENYEEAVKFLSLSIELNGPDPEILKNLATAQHKLGKHDEALANLAASNPKPEDDADHCDLACAIHAAKRDYDNARKYGEWSLLAKDRKANGHKGLKLTPLSARTASHANGRDVVSFTLFGRHPRYLRGALRNAMLMGDIYPSWQMRVYAGLDVPDDFVRTLTELNVDVIRRDQNVSGLARLGWRFEVANDPNVNRFMVRDIDSVVNVREAQATHDWIESGKTFHVLRDWWSHTDPILAGMWSGHAGALPDLTKTMANYRPPHVETRNIDQWFLRDCIWPLIRAETLVHDRCFRCFDAKPFPGPPLPFTAGHVGQDEIAVRGTYQDVVLAPYLEKLPYLRVKFVAG